MTVIAPKILDTAGLSIPSCESQCAFWLDYCCVGFDFAVTIVRCPRVPVTVLVNFALTNAFAAYFVEFKTFSTGIKWANLAIVAFEILFAICSGMPSDEKVRT
jgi:hypothetical protein